MLALPEPECMKGNRGLLGTLNYAQRFFDGYAKISAPLVELSCQDIVKKTAFKKAFAPAQREAFARAKRALTSAPVPKCPDFTREFIIHTDESESEVEAFLTQSSRESNFDSDLDLVAYCSHRLSRIQRYYSATMKGCYAVIWAVTHWRPYLWGKHFTCCTDHQALTCL